MRAIKSLKEETRRRAELPIQLKTHTEQHCHRKVVSGVASQQAESEALFQQRLDSLVQQKREQQKRDRQFQQRLDTLAAQRQRVSALLRVHLERNRELYEIVARPASRKSEASNKSEAAKDKDRDRDRDGFLHIVASSHLNEGLGGKRVAPPCSPCHCRAGPVVQGPGVQGPGVQVPGVQGPGVQGPGVQGPGVLGPGGEREDPRAIMVCQPTVI